MRIEDYKNSKISSSDIKYLESVWKEDKIFIIYELCEQHPLFEDIKLGCYDRLSFFKLKTICHEIITNYSNKKAFCIALSIIYYLFDISVLPSFGVDYAINHAVVDLYDALASLVYDGNMHFELYSEKAKELGIERDTSLAISYWQKAHLIEPNYQPVLEVLAIHYFDIGDYHKAYGYLPRYEYLGRSFDSSIVKMYTLIGYAFEKENKEKTYLMEFDTFNCFYNAYMIAKNSIIDSDISVKDMSTAIYNMAHCYIDGVYLEKDIRKGISHLQELIEYLFNNGEDTKEIDDPYGIIKDYDL